MAAHLAAHLALCDDAGRGCLRAQPVGFERHQHYEWLVSDNLAINKVTGLARYVRGQR